MVEASERLKRHLEGRYRIERELGRGGMATVYLAADLKHGREVAIKTLDPELAAAIGPERFRREIEIAAQLHHPHILALFDSGDAEGVLFYVMPYVSGESLRARLRREPQLPLDEALRIAREVADALAYAHGRGVVHRDVKPENILIQSGHALLADFGIARATPPASGGSLTVTGTTLGTPAYMSPEQFAGSRDLDARSDIYSLGCVLYEMLAGQPPFTGATADVLARQHLAAEPPDVRIPRPGAPPHVAAAIRRALAKSPADRFRTAPQFADALSANAAPTGATTAALTPGAAHHPGTAHARGRWRALGVVAIAAALALGAWLTWRGARRTTAPAPSASAHARTEIAVLPFQNLSSDPALAYFAGGLEDELLTQLCRVASLKVISRTSVMGYRGSSKPLKTIASELGVGSVVEGSVQAEGRRLRVTVQLIDAATDDHLWAEHYDRTLDDAFAIQSEVAQKIVAAVGSALTDAERARLTAPPTANAEAYRLYLQGVEYLNRPGIQRSDLESAVQLFGRAIQLDPGFALAHAERSLAEGSIYWLRYDTPDGLPTHARRQREEAEAALKLAPDLPEAHVAMGVVHLFSGLDFDGALRELAIARQAMPSDYDVWVWTAAAERRSGNVDAAIAAFRQTVRLNPRDADKYFDIGGRTFKFARRYAEAISAFDTALALAPDLHVAAIEKGLTYILWRGQTDTLRVGLDGIPADFDVGPYGSVAAQRAEQLLLSRAADPLMAFSRAHRGGAFRSRFFFRPAALYAGWACRLKADSSGARIAFARAFALLDSVRAATPDDWRVHASRGVALANLGRRNEARREAEWLRNSATYQRDAIDGPDLGVGRAQILAAVGDDGPALDELDRRLSRPGFISTSLLAIDPRFDSIRGTPRFQALIAKYEEHK